MVEEDKNAGLGRDSIPADELAHVERFANLVKKFGFQMERRMLTDQRNSENPNVAFLFKKSSAAYRHYRELTGEDKEAEKTEEAKEEKSEPPSKSHAADPANPPESVKQPTPSNLGSSALSDEAKAKNSGAMATNKKRRRFTENPDDEAASENPLEGVNSQVQSYAEDYEYDQQDRRKPASGSTAGGYGRHIPQDVLENFMAKSRGEKVEKKEAPAVDESNVGHKLLSKMGWKQGSGLGKSGGGAVTAVKSKVKTDKAGVGSSDTDPADVKADDDIVEQYRKRMMLAYRYRPNPMNNPRRGYDGYDPGGV